ncbi:hypothetical protein LTR17_020059 [Elasticomyces elasticus]|nr:hypothetical protein LTR17_020059 [Elasticomyces elasticus]
MDLDTQDPLKDEHRFSGAFMHKFDASSPRFTELPATTALGMPMGMAENSLLEGPQLQNIRIGSSLSRNLRGVATQMAAFVVQGDKDETDLSHETVQKPTITPAAFARAFKAMKGKAVADGDMKWAGECPVLVEEHEESEVANGS